MFTFSCLYNIFKMVEILPIRERGTHVEYISAIFAY